MTTQVYRHKIRLVTDAMIKRGIELGIEKDDLDFLRKLYEYEDSDKYLDYYLSYSDENLVFELINEKTYGYAKEIFNRLITRV